MLRQVSILTFAMISAACNEQAAPPPQALSATADSPASAYCQSQGGNVKIVRDDAGGEVGYCHLKGGVVVEEWDYYNANLKDSGI